MRSRLRSWPLQPRRQQRSGSGTEEKMGLTGQWSGYWVKLTLMRNRAVALNLRIFAEGDG
jgi:hypothetical protein